MTFPVHVGPSSITTNRDDRILICQPDGRITGEADGFFTRDTRFISGYDLWINGRRPILLSSAPIQSFSARFEFTNELSVDAGGVIDRQSLALRLDRTLTEAVHEDLDLTNYARRPVRLSDLRVLRPLINEPSRSVGRQCQRDQDRVSRGPVINATVPLRPLSGRL